MKNMKPRVRDKQKNYQKFPKQEKKNENKS